MSSVLPAPRILVVEDDPGMRTLLVRVLRESGLNALSVRNGREMWDAIETAPVEMILLDIMLPGTNGLDLCRALRLRSQVPIIMVSARQSETDRVLGLELGADDYIAKPFSSQELLARVRAVMRRSRSETETLVDPPHGNGRDTLSFAGWCLNLRRRELADPSGAAVDLSGAEHDLLLCFLENPQRVIGRERLLELSRNRLSDSSDRSIDVLVSRLRRKVGGSDQPLIRTVRGAGYMFAADVERR